MGGRTDACGYNRKARSYVSPGISFNGSDAGCIYNLRKYRNSATFNKISGNSSPALKSDGDDVYIAINSAWCECGILMLCGSIISVEAVSNIPSSAIEITQV